MGFWVGYSGGVYWAEENLNKANQVPLKVPSSLIEYETSNHNSIKREQQKKMSLLLGFGGGIVGNPSLPSWHAPDEEFIVDLFKNYYYLHNFEISLSYDIISDLSFVFKTGLIWNKVNNRQGNLYLYNKSNWDILALPLDFIIQKKWGKVWVGAGYEYIFFKAVDNEEIGVYAGEPPKWIEISTYGRGHGVLLSLSFISYNKSSRFLHDINITLKGINPKEFKNTAEEEVDWKPIEMSFSGLYIRYNLGFLIF